MSKSIVTTTLAMVVAIAMTLGVAAPAFADGHCNVTGRSTISGKCLAPQGEWRLMACQSCRPPATAARSGGELSSITTTTSSKCKAVTLKCLDVVGRNANRVSVIQWPCSGINNQRFQASSPLSKFVPRRSRVAGTSTHCLDVPGELAKEAAAMHIWDCDGTPAQAFGVSLI